MPWIKQRLKGKEVYARCSDKGELAAAERGLVDVVYKLSPSSKIYRASSKNLTPSGDAQLSDDSQGPSPDGNRAGDKVEKTAVAGAPLPKDAIVIYTDGACSKNPGPMGIGAVIIDKGERQEISEYLGTGTNNIAELTAIERALETVPGSERKRAVVVHTDSTYSIGVLDKGWKAKANTELVARIRGLCAEFSALRFVKVKGHAGIPENERCDELATSAIAKR